MQEIFVFRQPAEKRTDYCRTHATPDRTDCHCPSSPKVAKQPLAANCASPRPVSGYMLSLAATTLRILDKTCVIIFK